MYGVQPVRWNAPSSDPEAITSLGADSLSSSGTCASSKSLLKDMFEEEEEEEEEEAGVAELAGDT